MWGMANSFCEKLLAWYDENRRILPWRESPSPYGTWLSEIMLQQTRVEAGKAYYLRFMEALPTIEDLANAEEDLCLKLWEGLGYYSRVRNLHKAAKKLVEEYDGELPCDVKELTKLPGIGEYTASAIASMAFGKKEVAVDGNLLRVYSRLEEDSTNIKDPKAKEKCRAFFLKKMDERPGDFNQALMDLGELVCLPNGAPKCDACPLASFCKAHKAKKEQDYPVVEKAKTKKEEGRIVFLLQYQGKIAIRKRPDTGLLASLYEFPNVLGEKEESWAANYLKEKSFSFQSLTSIGEAKHVFSHLVWKMKGYRVELDALPKENDLLFVTKEELLERYSIPSAFSYYLKAL